MRFLGGLVVLTALVLVSLSIGSAPVSAVAYAVPCADARGCPDLLPNTHRHRMFAIVDRTFLSTDCSVQEGFVPPGERRLLQFPVETGNAGPGDLHVGNPAARPDLFEFSPCHQHYHFKGFAQYSLWRPADYGLWRHVRDASPDLLREVVMASSGLPPPVVQSRKMAFCMEDVLKFLPGDQAARKYTCADQGIQAGWSDVYGNGLPGQWVDITGVPAGNYILEVELNPDWLIQEGSYADNVAAASVSFTDGASKCTCTWTY